jgi:hypothetical protein
LEDKGVDEKVILKWSFKKLYGGKDWIGLPQNRDKWQALVNTVMNFQMP